MLNSLGLSDGLLRVIDRRQRMDRVITYGGMVSSSPTAHRAGCATSRGCQCGTWQADTCVLQIVVVLLVLLLFWFFKR